MSKYLGIDASTQSMTALIIDVEATPRIAVEESVIFDEHFGGRYGVENGTIDLGGGQGHALEIVDDLGGNLAAAAVDRQPRSHLANPKTTTHTHGFAGSPLPFLLLLEMVHVNQARVFPAFRRTYSPLYRMPLPL